MRIGVITLPLHTNIGGILQAYALQTVLQRMGHRAILLNKLYKLPKSMTIPRWRIPLACVKRAIYKYILRKKVIVFYERYYEKTVIPTIRTHTRRFINEHIHYKIVKSYRTLSRRDYDALIVGSDQVWRGRYLKADKPAFFLEFAKNWNVRRIAYAASFGTTEWEYTEQETEYYRQLLKKFCAVSVREDSGVDMCKRYLDVDAVHVLDPTMLLTSADYIKLCATEPKSDGNLLVCTLDTSPQKAEISQYLSSIAYICGRL